MNKLNKLLSQTFTVTPLISPVLGDFNAPLGSLGVPEEAGPFLFSLTGFLLFLLSSSSKLAFDSLRSFSGVSLDLVAF